LRRPLSWLVVLLLRCYQGTLSHLWPNVCIYEPSCSHYMLHAVVNRGLVRGLALGTWRLLRCHPLARGGYDPPPGREEASGPPAAGGQNLATEDRMDNQT
jgi:putative membrane protein insertion efficiency factor